MTEHRQAVIAAVERWWDKYKVSLAEIEARRASADQRVRGHLKELGYVS